MFFLGINKMQINKDDIKKWYIESLDHLNKFTINGEITDEHARINLNIYKKDDQLVNISEFCKTSQSIGLGIKPKTWSTYVDHYSKSRLPDLIFKLSIKDKPEPINLFNAIVHVPRQELNTLIDKYEIEENETTENIKQSLELVLMNAIRYYYVHASLSEILVKEGKCDSNYKSCYPFLLLSSGTTDPSSDYDLTLHIYKGKVAEIVNTFYTNVMIDWGQPSDKIFDTNIYTSAYLIPISIIKKNINCYDLINVYNNITNDKCSTYLNVKCYNDNAQIVYALYHLLEMTDRKRIDKTIKLFEKYLNSNSNITDLYLKIDNIINDMIYDYESITKIKVNKIKVNKKISAIDLHDSIINDITDDIKKVLYTNYTKKLYKYVKNQNPVNTLLCDLIAKLNICMPETYYTYGALILNVVIAQFQYNIVIDEFTNNVFICALIEDYAYVMNKYKEFIEEKLDYQNKDVKYIGKCAKYVWRMIHSFYIIECTFTKRKCASNIIYEIKNKNTSIPELKLAIDVLKLKKFKDNPRDNEAVDSYKKIIGNEMNFEQFINWIDTLVQTKSVMFGGFKTIQIAKINKSKYLNL